MSPAAPPTARSPIQHVFFLIKENHALENYFGDLPGVVGYPPNGSFPVAFGSNVTVQPFALRTAYTSDLPHDRTSELVDLDGGRNDLFVAEAAAEGYADPRAAVGYYTSAEIPDYYTYAHQYTLDDMFFSGVLGPTLPNRLFDLGLTGVTWTSDLPPPISAVAAPTLPGQFAAAGLPWNYFYSEPAVGLPTSFVPQIADDACLASQIVPMTDLSSVLAGPHPPAFAYIDPENDRLYSEHPPSNVTLGDEWTVAVVNTIFQSPIGNSSAIFLFYDEAGGFSDPLVPPAQPPLGDGIRVPLLVLSPWTPAGRISHELLDPANLMRWTEANWGLPPLTPRIANAAVPVSLFNFTAPARAPVVLPSPISLAAVGHLTGAQSTGVGAPRHGQDSVAPTPVSPPVLAACPTGRVSRPRGLSRRGAGGRAPNSPLEQLPVPGKSPRCRPGPAVRNRT